MPVPLTSSSAREEAKRRNQQLVARQRAERALVGEIMAQHRSLLGPLAPLSSRSAFHRGGSTGSAADSTAFAATTNISRGLVTRTAAAPLAADAERSAPRAARPDPNATLHSRLEALKEDKLQAIKQRRQHFYQELKERQSSGSNPYSRTSSHAAGCTTLTSYTNTCYPPPGAGNAPLSDTAVTKEAAVGGIECFTVVPGGGCSVWTSAAMPPDYVPSTPEDGTVRHARSRITIRNAALVPVVELPPREIRDAPGEAPSHLRGSEADRGDGPAITMMQATTGGQVWVGYSDGHVQVYDGELFIIITEGAFHGMSSSGAAVLAIAECFDRRVVTGAADGSIVKWDDETRGFEVISRLMLPNVLEEADGDEGPPVRPPEGVSRLATLGYRVFVGCTLTGRVAVLDIQNEEEIMSLPLPGGKSLTPIDVTALAVADEYLFAAYSNARVHVWNLDSGCCVHAVRLAGPSAAVSFHCDYINFPLASTTYQGRIMLALSDGSVQVWSTLAGDRFATIQTIAGFASRNEYAHPVYTGGTDDPPYSSAAAGTEIIASSVPMRSLQALPQWFITRVLTVGSNGLSKLWYSMRHAARAALEDTAASLRGVLREDKAQLARIVTTTDYFLTVERRHRELLAVELERSTKDRLRRRYYYQLQLWRLKRETDHGRARAARAVCHRNHVSLLLRYLLKWMRWCVWLRRQSAAQAYKRALVPLLVQQSSLTHLLHLKRHVLFVRRTMLREKVLSMMLRIAQQTLMTRAFRRLAGYPDMVRQRRRRTDIAAELARVSTIALLRRRFACWYCPVAQKTLQKNRILRILYAMRALRLSHWRRELFRQWRSFLSMRRDAKAKELAVRTMEHAERQRLLSRYFSIMRRNAASHRLEAAEVRLLTRGKELAELGQRHAAFAASVEKQREAYAIQQKNARVRSAAAKTAAEADAAESMMQQRLERDEQEAMRPDAERDEGELLETMMMRLKAKAVNYANDYDLMASLYQRCVGPSRGEGSPASVFRDAHGALRRIAAEANNIDNTMDKGVWTLPADAVQQLQPEQVKVILAAIKTLAITFDLLSDTQRIRVAADIELLSNGEPLMNMLQACSAFMRRQGAHAPATTLARPASRASSANPTRKSKP